MVISCSGGDNSSDDDEDSGDFYGVCGVVWCVVV